MNQITKHLEDNFKEVKALEFYRKLFPQGSFDDSNNAVAVSIKGAEADLHVVDDDLEPIKELIESDEFIVISPVSYCGKTQRQTRANRLYALVFDVDGLKVRDGDCIGIKDLVHQMIGMGDSPFLPTATYIASSGNGVHVYYLLDKAIDIRNPETFESLRKFRHALVERLWNSYITRLHATPQFESITQGFRAVGSIAKDGKQRVRVFRIGERVSIDYLNGFVEEKDRIEIHAGTGRLSLEEAKSKYPEWYEKRIVKGQPKGTWVVKEDLYNWWLRRINVGAKEGHRYFCIMALAVYARKCGIDYKRLRKDAYSLLERLDLLTTTEDNHFTADEIEKALNAYRATYITFPRKNIEELTDIAMPANKRNGRKQEEHLARIRLMRDFDYPDGSWRGNGRKPKRIEVIEYIAQSEETKPAKIANALGVSRPTVYKYLEEIKQSGMSASEYLKSLI